MGGKRITHSEEWWATAPAHVLRCTAHYKDGSPCRREAAGGANVCNQHGALAPAVQAAAATRMQMSVDQAAAHLVAWMNDPSVDMRERVKIAHDLLDRGGLAATAKHLIGVAHVDPVEAMFRSLLADPDALEDPTVQVVHAPDLYTAQTAREIAAAEGEGDHPLGLETGTSHAEDVVDAEVVEDPPPGHTLHVTQSMSSRLPPHLRQALADLL